jgi:uncharacterized protein (DUF1015 family)
MARLEPFSAIRYDSHRIDPDTVVAPPYDVVSPQERALLAKRSPYNAIYLDLPAPDESSGLDQYENAARILHSWLANGILRQDSSAAFYVYRMTFHDDRGHRQAMTGLLGALGLDLSGGGDVLPHEQTLPKDRLDRLLLLRRLRLNTSPIWGLSLARGLAVACREAQARTGEASFKATDDAGVVHELWPITDEGSIGEISRLGATAPVLIADGHHRYQTACTYAEECRASNGDQPGPHDFVLAFIVELSEEELSVRAIHRLVRGIETERLLDLVSKWYRVEPAPEDLVALPATSVPGVIGLLTRDGYKLLYPLAALDQAADDDLDSSRLHVLLSSLPEHELAYETGWHEAAAAVRDGRADAAFFVRPVPVARIESVAATGRLMAPKTTFFYPKPRSGMAFRSLE